MNHVVVQEEIEEEDMKEFFSDYGNITDIVRMKDKETGKGRRQKIFSVKIFHPISRGSLVGYERIVAGHNFLL